MTNTSEKLPGQEEMPSPKAPHNETAAYFETHEDAITPEYLNNLYTWLPGSAYRKAYEAHFDDAAKTFIRDVEKALESLPEIQEGLARLAADRQRLTDEAAAVEEQLSTLMAELRNLPKDEKAARFQAEAMPLIAERDRLTEQSRLPQRDNEALVPLYHALRRMGYSHQDIIG